MQREDLTGRTFNRLTVIRYAGRDITGHALCACHCACGKELVVTSSNLRSGNSQSCGCLGGGKGQFPKRNVPPEYQTWKNMIQRCYNPKCPSYKYYGARGIDTPEPWLKYVDFAGAVLAEIGPRPEGKTFDRIDNDKRYQPGNIRWATPREQNLNRRPRATKYNTRKAA